MHIITTKAHGLLDYIFAVFLFTSPWAFGFNLGGAETGIPVTIGTMIPILSLFTKYEGGLIRVIPMRIHLLIDILTGAILAFSPWFFGFADKVYIPHLVLGIFMIISSLLTDGEPFVDQHDPRRVIP